MEPHIVVIGAGAFGGWTALHLLRKGAKVTLLDAWGAGHSRASSGGETRVIRHIYGAEKTYVEWAADSLQQWQENEKLFNAPIYFQTGCLWLFNGSDAYVRETLPHLKPPIQIDQYSIQEAKKHFPSINFSDIDTVYFEKQAGFLRARLGCQEVVQVFVKEGGQFLRASAKIKKWSNENAEALALSDGSTLSADAYIFACGPWLKDLFPERLGKYLYITRQEVYYFGTPAGNQQFNHNHFPTWVEYGKELFYGIPNFQNRGFKIGDDDRNYKINTTTDDRQIDEKRMKHLRDYLGHRFPVMQNAPLVEGRVCQYCNTLDGNFILDQLPGFQNVWIAGGGSGHGYKLGPSVGKYMAEQVLWLSKKKNPIVSFERFNQLKDIKNQWD